MFDFLERVFFETKTQMDGIRGSIFLCKQRVIAIYLYHKSSTSTKLLKH